MNSLSLNEQGVRNLQKYLRTLSFFNEFRDIPQIAIDGIYGKETRNAVSTYQKIKRLTQTGTANQETYDSIYRDYDNASNYKKFFSPAFNFPRYPRNFELNVGSRGFYVYLIKHLLNELRKNRDSHEELELNDIYDNNVANAVKEIQKTYQIPQTGNVDPLTWYNIVTEFNNNQIIQLE